MALTLQGWEVFAATGTGVAGATVQVIPASLFHPNLTAPSYTGTTDANGFWQTTSLADGFYDILVTYLGKVKWYKGLTQFSGFVPTQSFGTQNANRVLASPSSGGASYPSFRSLVQADLGADWTAWTPTAGMGAALTLTVNYARYCIVGKIAQVYAQFTITGGGTAGNQLIISGVPAAIAPLNPGVHRVVGNLLYYDTGVNYNGGALIAVGGNDLRAAAPSGAAAGVYLGNTPSLTPSNGDIVNFSGAWEIA